MHPERFRVETCGGGGGRGDHREGLSLRDHSHVDDALEEERKEDALRRWVPVAGLLALLWATPALAWGGGVGYYGGGYGRGYGGYGYRGLSGYGGYGYGWSMSSQWETTPFTVTGEIICSKGKIEDRPEDERIFWHDGESNYGPKYRGMRCIGPLQ